MDIVADPIDDDLDLDALMVRVREAAMAGTARPETAADPKDADIDLVRVIDAQGEWNEHTRQSLVALVECLRTLRDDWTEAHARLQEEVGQLSTLVGELRRRKVGGSARTPAKRRPRKAGRRR
jgi:hypothetical protein